MLPVACVCPDGSGTSPPHPSRLPWHGKGPCCPCPARCQGQGHLRILCLGMLSCISCLENRPHSVPSCCHCHEGGHGSHGGACWDFPKQFGEGLSPRCAAELWSAVVHAILLWFHVGATLPGDLSSCDDRTSQVFPLQDVAVGGGDSECAFVAMHRQCPGVHLLLQDTRWALRAEGVKLLPNSPLHANKVPWSWSSRQTPGYYPSI